MISRRLQTQMARGKQSRFFVFVSEFHSKIMFSTILIDTHLRFFSGNSGGYNNFFQMTDNGLPTQFTGCSFPETYAVGNAVRIILSCCDFREARGAPMALLVSRSDRSRSSRGRWPLPPAPFRRPSPSASRAARMAGKKPSSIFMCSTLRLIASCDPGASTATYAPRGETSTGSLIYVRALKDP